MMINFDEMPNDSRIWIYQSNRKFSQSEENEISIKIQSFLKDWTAHGSNLFSSYCIRYNRFIVIALNETKNKATGCSIDASVALIQSIEKDYSIDLLDKMNVSFKQGDYISYKSIIDFKNLIKDKSVSKNTIVFNNLVTDISDFKNNWEIPAYKSWHSRLF